MDKFSQEVDWTPLVPVKPKPALYLDILLGIHSRLQEILITSILAASHHKIHVVDNGLTAVHSLKLHSFHICLLSYDMPELNAVKATKMIRASKEAWCQIPTIGLMEAPNAIMLAESHLAGMNAWINAPFSAPKILAMVNYYQYKLSNKPQ